MRTNLLTLGLVTFLAVAAQASQEQLAFSLKEARTEALRTSEGLQATLASITALTKQKEGDLRPAFNAFTAEIPKTQSAAAWTRTRLQWMRSDALGYFSNWQKTVDGIGNASVKKQAQKRLDTAKKGLGKAETALKVAGEKFTPFLSDLEDMQKALSADLTAGGVKAIKGLVSDANWRYQEVNSAIKRAVKEMEKIEKELAPEAK